MYCRLAVRPFIKGFPFILYFPTSLHHPDPSTPDTTTGRGAVSPLPTRWRAAGPMSDQFRLSVEEGSLTSAVYIPQAPAAPTAAGPNFVFSPM